MNSKKFIPLNDRMLVPLVKAISFNMFFLVIIFYNGGFNKYTLIIAIPFLFFMLNSIRGVYVFYKYLIINYSLNHDYLKIEYYERNDLKNVEIKLENVKFKFSEWVVIGFTRKLVIIDESTDFKIQQGLYGGWGEDELSALMNEVSFQKQINISANSG